MPGSHPKNLQDFLPALFDQGIPNVVATPGPGVGLQFARFTMGSAPDDFVFADNGLGDMEDDQYEVIPWNQSDVADQGVISAKTTKQFTITGPDAADEVTLIIVGRLKNQVA